MTNLPIMAPGRVGFLRDRLEKAYELLRQWSDSGEVAGSVLCVGGRGGMVEPRGFGVGADSLFLVASITKPIVSAAAMALVERGLITLDDRVVDYLPEFIQQGKQEVRIRHLLNHTSGLPDMLPENESLRAAHAPLWSFVEGTCRVAPMFEPGTRVRYQSMGFAVLGEIIQRAAKRGLADFLYWEFFEPLGMRNSYLGCPPEQQDRIARCQLHAALEETDWNWNTPYWRGLGAPWGGMVMTAEDLARYCRMMLDEGVLGKTRVLSPASVRAMTRNQLASLSGINDEDRRTRPWGLGWRLQGAGHSPNLGDLLGEEVYCHWGATGTLCWIDPAADAFCILLTTKPQGEESRHLALVSNAVAAALA